jgi:hypothetical protein
MISRMPHQNANGEDPPTCIHDGSEVWQTMLVVCGDDKCWTCVKPFQQTRDGHGAFQGLQHTHCLGDDHISTMASIAQSKLTQAKCFGEKR